MPSKAASEAVLEIDVFFLSFFCLANRPRNEQDVDFRDKNQNMCPLNLIPTLTWGQKHISHHTESVWATQAD
jgi:hypothetical protein